MPRPTQAALSLWMIVAGTCSLAAQDRIAWVTDLQTARQMAQQQQRLVLLHFWTESCMPCQRLERNVFNQPELIRAVAIGYIPVKINAQQAPALADYYKITAVPTDIVVDPDGREVYRATSPQDANRYIAMLDQVKARHAVSAEPLAETQRFSGGDLASAAPARAAAGSPFAAASTTPSGQLAARPSETGSPAPSGSGQAGMVENPYTNPLHHDVPQQPASPVSPYAHQQSPASPPANDAGADLRQSSRWGGAAVAESSGNSPAAPAQEAARPPQAPLGWSQNASPGRYETEPTLAPANAPTAPAAEQAWQAPAAQPPAEPAAPRVASRAPQSVHASLPATAGSHLPMALDGFCAVTLTESSAWVKGDPRWGIYHRGRTYLFASDEQRQRFWANPERYAPVLAGCDPVRLVEAGQRVEGKREHGVFYRERIYLFADEEALERFGQQPDYYVAAADQAQQRGMAGGP